MGAAIILGILDGLQIALIALGIVLIFRGSRFVNFAQAQLGILPMLLTGKLVIDAGLSWWIAAPLMVAAGALIGAAAEFFVIRRLSARGPLTLLVATIGIGQLLVGFSYFNWMKGNPLELALGFPVPFQESWNVGDLSIYTNRILTIFAVPLICAALYVFFKSTRTGKGIRAAASNREAAVLAGLPVRRLSLITWGIAGALSAVTAILAAPNQVVFDPATLGPALLLPALGAAAFGAFTSFQITFLAAVALGVIQQLVSWQTGDGTWGALAVFIAVLLGLFLRAKAIGLAGTGGGAGDRIEGDETAAYIPPAVRDRVWVRHSRGLLVTAALALCVLAPLVFFTEASERFKLAQVLVTALLVTSVTVMAGWGGQLSLGQYAFAGIGAFIATRFIGWDWSLPANLIVSGVVGSAVAIVIGLPALRYKGLSLAVTTLGLAVIAPAWLFQQEWFWPAGYSGTSLSVGLPHVLGTGSGQLNGVLGAYFAILVVVAIVLAGAAALRRSIGGKVIIAVRDNEDAVAAAGIPPIVVKLGLFALVGFLASAVGLLDVIANQGVSAGRYTPDFSLLVLSMAVIGGLGSIVGAVVAAFFIFGLPLLLSDVVLDIFPGSLQLQFLLGGGGLLLALLTTKAGIAGEFRRTWTQILEAVARRGERRQSGAEPTEEEAATVSAESLIGTGGTRALRLTDRNGAFARSGQRETAPEPGVPALRVDDVTVRFGEFTAVDGVSLAVGQGEIVGLIGNNGAGKTTLINAISGHLSVAGGHVELFGQDATRMRIAQRARLGIGRTFQDARLYPGLTAHEIIEVAIAGRDGYPTLPEAALNAPWVRHHNAEVAAEALEVLDQVGMRRYADTLGASLSTGMRRVLDLAIQMARRPRLILLDEPTAGLAQRESEAFVPLLRNVAAELDASVLIIEHDMPVILGVTDRIYCLELGKVIAEGAPEEIRHDRRVIESYLGTGDGVAAARSGPLDMEAVVAAEEKSV